MEATGWVVVGEDQRMKLKSLKKIKPEVIKDLRLSWTPKMLKKMESNDIKIQKIMMMFLFSTIAINSSN